MELTTIIAKIFAIYLVASGASMFLRQKTWGLVLKDFYKHPATMFIAGFVMIVLGGLMVLSHNIWNGTLEIIVTLVAWATLIKGVLYIIIPDKIAKWASGIKLMWHPLGIIVMALAVWLFIVA